MPRREFTKAVRVSVIKRCTRDNNVYCEGCGGLAKRFQIDHVIPDALGGEPTLSNAQLLCEACFSVKNPKDTKDAAKAKRREANHIGAKPPSRAPIQNKQAAKREPRALASALPELPRKRFYEDAR